MREVDTVIEQFCKDFLAHPYLAYTEHGVHAQFFTRLFNALPESDRYFEWSDQKVCRIQKEYRMAYPCGKPRCQHWDISVIKTPPRIVDSMKPGYDYFELETAIEFGLNENEEHLKDDIERLDYEDSHVCNKRIVHLSRISKNFSKRDFSPKSKQIMSKEEIKNCLDDDVENKKTQNEGAIIHFVQVDSTKTHENGYWRIDKNEIKKVA
jgi:hypothetical protein